ncbi:kinase-like domain-containing protein [Rhizophagus diaphanus]|nr:kinase-like domain-containing protein [Rhizophagus diaphanus] [Rhizophagus sp. MUCL 43196]
MSDNIESEIINNSNKWINWIEVAISEDYFKIMISKISVILKKLVLEVSQKFIGQNWKNSNQYFALKHFFKPDDAAVKEIAHDLTLQREVDFHNNIIRFYGITKSDSENYNDQLNKYWLVMEYADSGTLRNYLKEHFNNLTWDDKYNLAYQLACAVSCLHDEGIVHRDLHPNNILVHQNTIKLADFGLSKRIEEAPNSQSKLYGIIPYIDPKRFNRRKNSNTVQLYTLNEKSEQYDIDLAVEISQGLREKIIPGTPENYVKIYTHCWNGEPENRPTINQVVDELKSIITKTEKNYQVDNKKIHSPNNQEFNKNNNVEYSSNTYNSLYDKLSRLIQNFDKMNTKGIDLLTSGNYFNTIVDELVDLSDKVEDEEKQKILNYLNNHNMTSQEIYNCLGICYVYGSSVDKDYNKAIELFEKLTEEEYPRGINYLGYCYQKGIGTDVNEQMAFELYQKAANLGNASGINNLGYCYDNGIGTNVDKQKAFELHLEAANLGNSTAQYNLVVMYENGEGIGKDVDQAIYWCKNSAE